MNYDVKNALDRALTICKAAEARTGQPFVQAFVGDVYSFISSISTANSDNRYDYFNMVYLQGSYPVEVVQIEAAGQPTRVLKMLEQYSTDRQFATTIVSFFLILGKYYSTSSLDRKDVSLSAVTQQIKLMNEYVKASMPASSTEKKAVKSQQLSSNPQEDSKSEPAERSLGSEEQNEPEYSLEELLEELNSLIGLQGVKQEVKQIIDLIKYRKKGAEFGEKNPPMSLHLVFYGNPGTGKTTVARILAKIYKCLGVLSSGQLVETDRGGLVAGYVGQTATKTDEAIQRAMGGILFIDEAYALTHGKSDNDFGQEAVDTLLKAMEDHRDDFIVIVAGYPDLMKEFLASNPGLKSRFNQFIYFEDYTPDELKQIFMFQCKQRGLSLAAGCDEYLTEFFETMYDNRAEDYANGRDVRNYFEKVIRAQASRLSPTIETVTLEEYKQIVLSDLQEAATANKTI